MSYRNLTRIPLAPLNLDFFNSDDLRHDELRRINRTDGRVTLCDDLGEIVTIHTEKESEE